jgi:maleylacetoacetate isomerase
MTLKLYNFFRTSAGHRVRIALALKGLDYEYVSVNIGPALEQRSDSYLKVNPQGLVPTLEHDGERISQSLAIIEYLEERFPEPAVLPENPITRARARAFACAIASEMHALNNSGLHRFLERDMNVDASLRQKWYFHWAKQGFDALEKLLSEVEEMPFCFGTAPSVADIFLVPQHLNYRRLGVPLDSYLRINRIVERCESLSAFQEAAPEAQPDYIDGF